MGFDPGLGLMHADKRYRPSLASDLMEPARPAADAVAVDLLKGRQLRRGDVFETRKGICRLGPLLAPALAAHASPLANPERRMRSGLRGSCPAPPSTRRPLPGG